MTKPRERAITMHDWEVLALLAGRKTVARRVMNPQPSYELVRPVVNKTTGEVKAYCDPDATGIVSPFGVPGDRLWVRETWQGVITDPVSKEKSWFDDSWPGVPDGRPRVTSIQNNLHSIVFRADGELYYGSGERETWQPSTQMPRWASRITLEVTGIRVERLQAITEDEAKAEGALGGCLSCGGEPCKCDNPMPSHHDGFIYHWNKANANRGYDFHSNPWVWRIEFRKVDQ